VAEESLLEKIRTLGPDELDEVEHFVDALRARVARKPFPAPTLSELAKAERALRWVAEHRREYKASQRRPSCSNCRPQSTTSRPTRLRPTPPTGFSSR